jgi:hypothetical protein
MTTAAIIAALGVLLAGIAAVALAGSIAAHMRHREVLDVAYYALEKKLNETQDVETPMVCDVCETEWIQTHPHNVETAVCPNCARVMQIGGMQ